MTTVYFVRHAQPNYDNRDDRLRELTEKGLKDRKLVTKFLSDKGIDIAISSPYKRSIDTIKEFTDEVGLSIITIEGLRERKIDSVWIEDFEEFSKKQWSDFSFKLSDGESLYEVQKRNIDALYVVLNEYEGKNIVIGSHGTALSTIINHYDKFFCYEDFKGIVNAMPWIVKICFDKQDCVAIEKFDLFT